MTFIFDDTYLEDATAKLENNTYLKQESNFRGTIIYHDLSGKISNTKTINKIKMSNKQASIGVFNDIKNKYSIT